MATSFTQKLINVAVKLANNPGTNQPNTFAEGSVPGQSSGANSVTISNSRTSVRIYNSGSFVENKATIKIWGLTPSLMNQLNTLGIVYNIVPKNTVTVTAGDAVNGMTTVFSGTIQWCAGDYEAMPDVPLIFECNNLLANAIAPVPAKSFTGPTDVAQIMQGFATQSGMGFQNGGVSIKLPAPYFSGTAKEQMQKCADWAGIYVGEIGGTIWIWPKGGSRGNSGPASATTPIISRATGMIAAPVFGPQGIIIKTLFNPAISRGGLIQVQSAVLTGVLSAQSSANPNFKAPSNNVWAVNKLDHALDSLVRNGQWMSTVHAYNPNSPKPIPKPIPPATG